MHRIGRRPFSRLQTVPPFPSSLSFSDFFDMNIPQAGRSRLAGLCSFAYVCPWLSPGLATPIDRRMALIRVGQAACWRRLQMTWRKTPDGSFLDHTGNVLFFSKDRFVNDICLGRCCFICGARPGYRVFNDEHVIPEWILRRFNLFDRTITLPNGETVKYGRFKVPCCQNCNSLMGHRIEERISKVVNSGPEAVQKHIADGNGLEFFVWLGLIFLKVHLKDREFRIHQDLRKPDDKIGDLYDWQALHHMHCLVRCFVERSNF